MKKRSLSYITLLFLSLLCSCSENSSSGARTSLGIRTPEISSIEAITPAISATTPYVNSGLWGLTTPVSLSEIDCFGIAVSYPEDTGSSCHLLSGGAIDIDEMFGSVGSGELLQADISSGLNRNIQVIGFATSDGSCPKDISSLSKEQMANSSAPVILGEKLADVEGESMEVEIVISMTNPIAVNDCSGESYAWEEGSPKSNNFAIENGYLTVKGSNLGSVRSALLKDALGNETELSVESRNNEGLALKSKSVLNLAMNMVYDLLISNAYGQQIFNITVGGNSGYNIINVNSDYNISNTEGQGLFLVDGSLNVTLPIASEAGAGFNIIIKSIGTGFDGLVRIKSQNGEKIDGTYENLILRSHLATVNLTSDGSNWWMLSSNGEIVATDTINSCDNNTCYSDAAFDDENWAIHSPTNTLMNRDYSGDPWRVPWIWINGTTAVSKYLINNNVNSNNSLYSFTKVWSVASEYDSKVMGTIAGESYGEPVDYSGGAYQIQGTFTDYSTSTDYSNHDGSSAVLGYLNTVGTVSENYNPPCLRYGGRLISQSDSSLPVLSNGKTYWSADSSDNGANYYVTWNADTGIFDTIGESSMNSNYFLCIWPDVVNNLGLE